MARRFLRAAAVALGVICAGPAAAVAHPLLVTAAPGPGTLVPGAPSSVTLAFSETAVARGSAITVTAPGRRSLRLGLLKSTDGGQQLSASVPPRLKPGVYSVHWVALGQDGHTVSGDFAFGIAESNGAPPPGAMGLGRVGDGARGGSAAGDSPITVTLRWMGIVSASLLWGAALLLAVLRRARVARAESEHRLALAIRLAWVALIVSVLYALVAAVSAGAATGPDAALIFASGTGISALVRALVVLAGAALYLILGGGRSSRRTPIAAIVGLGALACDGLSGHVLSQGSAAAAFGMAVHVVAAGTWAGGLIALVILVRSGELALADGARAYAPLAAGGLALAAVTGVIAAIREVNHWYFLWWFPYGRLILVKVVLVAVALAAGATMAVRPRRGVMGLEAGLVLIVLAVAASLSGLAQGRGQPLPAQRGDLLPGPSFASSLLRNGIAPVTLAPSRPGANTLVVIPGAGSKTVLARLSCGCDVRPVIARLHSDPGSGGAFSATIPVPTPGTWNAYVTIDGQAAASPVALTVGVPAAAGSSPLNLLSIADLSGPGASRCRAYLTGLELAIGRLNGSGGVDGGDKVALLGLDDGGLPSRAAALAKSALRSDSPIAFVPCGAGAESAVTAASRAGVPTIVGDPAVGVVPGPRVFRLAADPYADGYAIAQTIGTGILPVSAPSARTVRVIAPSDEQGARRLAGLRAGLASLATKLTLIQTPATAITDASRGQMSALLSRTRTVGLVLDGTDAEAPAFAAAISRLPARGASFAPAPVIATERLLSESFIDASGDAGRLGIVQGTSGVGVQSRDGLTLSQTIPALFPGERATLEALRGYVAGLALVDGVGSGTSAATIAARLTRPPVFTDALAAPWRADAPGAGSPRLGVLQPTFLSSNLLPPSHGGESYSGDYFSSGAWTRPTSAFYGPSLTAPVPPLSVGP